MAASKLQQSEVGGYDVILVNKLPPKYKCPLCTLLMRDPIQTYRGEMACESCYIFNKGDDNVCPIDHETIEVIEGREYFRDNYARREVQQFQIYCNNKENGCDWNGILNDIKTHSQSCQYELLICEKCCGRMVRKDVDHHVKDECHFRIMKCAYCLGNFEAYAVQEHEATCHLKPMECPYLCGKHVALDELYNHIEICVNVSTGYICPYKLVGCKYQPQSNDDMKRHLQMENILHATLTVSTVKHFEQVNVNLRQDITNEQTFRRELESKIEEGAKQRSAIVADVQKIQETLHEVQKECVVLTGKCDDSVKMVANNLKEIDLHTQERNLMDIGNKLTEIDKQYSELDIKIKSGLAGRNPANSGVDVGDLQAEMSKINQLENGSAVQGANLSDLESKLQVLENTCYEGKQLWKIDNIAYRSNQAITGKVTALHSAPCFLGRGSYKFCSRLYLNGDGMGRGTHVSLFFVVMKSEYDALLTWPFAERVTFRLINPYNRDESVRESFIPDKNSSSFKRPTKDMNIAAGCPMFIKRERLQDFIVDDTIYIETFVGSDIIH